MPSTTLVYEAAIELLKDGEWHDYHKTIRHLAKRVPPGIAMRAVEYQRLARARQHGNYRSEERKRERSDERLIQIGAEATVRKVLNGAAFEIDPRHLRGVPKRIRLRPGHSALQSPNGQQDSDRL